MCLLTNQPLQLAILTEKAGLLLLQAVDVPGEQLIIFHSQCFFVDCLHVLLKFLSKSGRMNSLCGLLKNRRLGQLLTLVVGKQSAQ